MVSLMELCENTRKSLKRELQAREIDFLKCVYERHQMELNETGTDESSKGIDMEIRL